MASRFSRDRSQLWRYRESPLRATIGETLIRNFQHDVSFDYIKNTSGYNNFTTYSVWMGAIPQQHAARSPPTLATPSPNSS